MDGQSFLECINSIAPVSEFDSDESDLEDVSRAEVRRTLSEEEVGDCMHNVVRGFTSAVSGGVPSKG